MLPSLPGLIARITTASLSLIFRPRFRSLLFHNCELNIFIGHHEDKLMRGKDRKIASQEEPEEKAELGAEVQTQILIQGERSYSNDDTEPSNYQPAFRFSLRCLLCGAFLRCSQGFHQEEPPGTNGTEGRKRVKLLLNEGGGVQVHNHKAESVDYQRQPLRQRPVIDHRCTPRSQP